MSKWTAADMPDPTGRTAVVTGATSGIGRVAPRELAHAGAHVTLAVLDTARGEKVAAEDALPSFEVRRLDLADLASVRAFASGFGIPDGGLDLLVSNAGVMALPRRETADGFEMQFGTNHLGHFVAQDAEAGARPTLYAATAPELTSGAYIGPDGPGEARGHPTLVGTSGRARDEGDARRLWEVSERETGVEYVWAP